MAKSDPTRTYPELCYGGFSKVDCTVPFLCRAQAMASGSSVVLEVGCGRGVASEDTCAIRRELRDFRRTGRRVIGIDVDQSARSNPFIDEFRIIRPGAPWPIESRSISMAFCDYVLEHVEDPSSFFAELERVLLPGGSFIARTPSKWSYVAIAASLVPNRSHAAVLAKVQDSRKEEDVFPTVYRANTRRTLLRLLRSSGLDATVYSVEGEPNYLRFSRFAYATMATVHQWLPSTLRSTLIVLARKPNEPSPSGLARQVS